MADPLGVTASIIAVFELTTKLVRYVNTVKEASKDRQTLSKEAINLLSLLSELKDRADEADASKSWNKGILSLNEMDGPLLQFGETLSDLLDKVTLDDDGKLQVVNRITRARVRLTWSFFKDKVESLLSQIERLKSHISIVLQNDSFKLQVEAYREQKNAHQAQLDHMKAQDDAAKIRFLQTEIEEIFAWLSPLDFSKTHQYHSSTSHREGTCKWLLEDSTTFAEWRSKKDSTLWCWGIPGAGKTVLSSLVIDHLCSLPESADNKLPAVAYIYLKYNEPDQTAFNLITSIVKQLIQYQYYGVKHWFPPALLEMYEGKPGPIPKSPLKPDEITKVVRKIVEVGNDLYIVIDALDECSETTRKAFLTYLREFDCNTHIFITSRFSKSIERGMINATQVEVSANNDDIRGYLHSRITGHYRLSQFVATEPPLLDEIVKGVLANADGMFLLPKLRMDTLEEDVVTHGDVRVLLEDLPQTLQDKYSEAMQRIKNQHKRRREIAIDILSWIFYALRPLTVEEIQHALAVRIGSAKFDRANILWREDLTGLCAGFVVIDDQNNIVRLVHETAQHYLELMRTTELTNAWNSIGQKCLMYLSWGLLENSMPISNLMKSLSFLGYTLEFWPQHLKSGPDTLVERSVLDLGLDMVNDEKKRKFLRALIQHYLGPRRDLYGLRDEDVSGLALAVWSGSREVSSQILDNGYEINSQNSQGVSAVDIAIYHRNKDLVDLLVERGAFINLETDAGLDVLMHASRDSGEITHMILKGGINPSTSPSGKFQVSFLAAAHDNCDAASLQHLLDQPEVISAKPSLPEQALFLATERGCETAIRVLLENGVNVNARGIDGESALHRAAFRANHAVIQLLLGKGADINQKDERGKTAWNSISKLRTHRETLTLLRKAGADPNTKDNQGGRNPIYIDGWADVSAMRHLLDNGVNPSITTDYGWHPMHWATQGGAVETIKLFIERGANVSVLCDQLKTPLDMVDEKKPNSREAKQVLLDAGAVSGRVAARRLAKASVEQESINVPRAVAYAVLRYLVNYEQGHDDDGEEPYDSDIMKAFVALVNGVPSLAKAKELADTAVEKGTLELSLNLSMGVLQALQSGLQDEDGTLVQQFGKLLMQRVKESPNVIVQEEDNGVVRLEVRGDDW